MAPDIGDDALNAMRTAGVRGLRVGTKTPVRFLEQIARRAARHDMHVQLLTQIDDLPALKPLLEKLAVRVVVDHFGHLEVARGVHDPGFRALLDLVVRRTCFVKISAAYRITRNPASFIGEMRVFAQALYEANPAGVVRGTDWPHPATEGLVSTEATLRSLFDWFPDASALARIMVATPEVLYEF